MTIKEFFSFKKNKLFWANLIAMVLVAIFLVFIVFKWLNVYTRHGEAIEVPDARGKSVAEAKALFSEHELRCVVSDSAYVKEKRPGIILDHNPQSGQRVKKGRIIYLTTNTFNTPMQMVPDVANNSSLRQAQARVLASGFHLAEKELIKGEKDWVYEIKYHGKALQPGEKVPLGATLTLVVGNGDTQGLYNETDSLNMDIILKEPAAGEEDAWF